MKNLAVKLAFTFLTICVFCAGAIAQAVFVPKDIQGRRIMVKTNIAMDGSPYLNESWAKGSVKLMNGTVYEDMLLKYDQLEDELIYNAGNDDAQAFLHPVYEFTIQQLKDNAVVAERKYRKGFNPVDGASQTAFYEILADGNTQLLKRTSKAIVEERLYGSATVTQKVKEAVNYYIVTSGGNLVKIKQDKKSILKALENKSADVDKYIKENRLYLKDDTDLTKLVAYYNTL